MINIVLLWSAMTLGLFSICSSMSKHQKQVFEKTLSVQQSKILFYLGWGILIISFIYSLFRYSPSLGMSYWVGAISFAALLVGFTLSYLEKHFKRVVATVIASFILACLLAISR
ncbi:DUF3325 domain-containing protein [Acinetobacter larvae]|uniref:DUF3325 domain-containing protein n=1 Tax=Acinetobacter larvae TaxID=1789224 RepID=A0A1B2LXF0_9GAMM|nr:DUF3325 domain-containing protein [Acinetobacter larvae]AOA57605.1 hypothetical protein BFG52_04035 [Acinetobacter larvae]